MYNEVVKKIKEFDTIVIARHIGVDPDALCSQLALRDSILLTYPEKKVLAIGTGSSRFLNFGKLDKLEKFQDALLIILDTPDKKRVDSLDFSLGSYLIKIDHHPLMDQYCDLEIIEDDKSSTCEILMNMIDQTELKCNDSIAELLYMGLASDSNRFLFNSCDYKTFEIVSKYFKNYHISLDNVYEKLYTRPINEVRLEGYISLNMKITKNKLGYIVITDDIINQYGVDSASAGNMINNFNYIKEILVWVTITEDKKNNQFRVSIRSRGPKINTIAEKYNGGGHPYASGIKLKSLDDAYHVLEDLDKELENYIIIE
ncbi:MAG: bifunctional oligoribonuclease/PAP phosphatase NrnA [Bacilli bacterium]|nr:bifunctional oligoribonuclease/PAP phosphatase NrnA [Bacilli bacterium]